MGSTLFNYAFNIFYWIFIFKRFINVKYVNRTVLYSSPSSLPRLCATGGCVWDMPLELVAMVKHHGASF